jgi:cellulose synthase/poly-beta-1,6-N-acetylglucosamine synthase-like glycosyltransferase
MAEILLWTSLAAVAYVYIGYPLLLFVAARLLGQPVKRRPWLPTVSILIAAHNEERFIRRKLESVLALNYPPHLLQILVGCDGCTDATEAAVRDYAWAGIRLVSLPHRCGKAATINRMLELATGEVILFGDARQTYHPDALRELVADLADPAVAGASGSVVLTGGSGAVAQGAGLYRRYDEFLRHHEALLFSTLGAAGAIYAMRRELCEPLPEDAVLDDFEMPMRAVAKGYRIAFEPAAMAYDIAPSSSDQELRRKVRTLAGNYQALWRLRSCLHLGRSPVAWQLLSHKVGRLVAPFALIVALMANAATAVSLSHHGVLLAMQVAFYGLAAVGAAASRRGIRAKVLCLPYVFALMNWAALLAFFRVLRGGQTVAWERAFETVIPEVLASPPSHR